MELFLGVLVLSLSQAQAGADPSQTRTRDGVVPDRGAALTAGAGPDPIGVVTVPSDQACTPEWKPTFGAPGLDDVVYAAVVFDDGRGPALYAGGAFQRAGTVAAAGVARWDGERWSALAGGVGPAAQVYALAVFDGALYATGTFTSADGAPVNGIARWDGRSWSALGAGLSGGVFPAGRALAVFDDELYVGGSFTHAGGVAADGLARWNGSTWSAVGVGTGGSVTALCVFDDGNGAALHAGGLESAGGLPVNGVARWRAGSWSVLAGQINAPVLALTAFDDGTGPALYAGGQFSIAGSAAANLVARWNGASWSALGSGMDAGESVFALTSFDAGSGPELYAGGSFLTAGGAGASRIARWDGAHWSALNAGMESPVQALAVFDDGGGPALYAGGYFRRAGGTAANRIARWHGAWSALGTGAERALDGPVAALLAFDDGAGPSLIAGGLFRQAGELPANHIARWDGVRWSTLGLGLGAAPWEAVQCLAAFDDGGGPALYAGGSFSSAGGAPAIGIARWDGAAWSTLGPGLGGTFGFFPPSAYALVEFDDGSGPALYVGGDFTLAGGAPAGGIARWNGAAWSALSSGLSGPVIALAVFDDGTGPALYAGGEFVTTGAGLAVDHVARWDGASWSGLGTGLDGPVQTLAVYERGGERGLYAGGSFHRPKGGGPRMEGVARWDGASWSAVGGGITGEGSAWSNVATLSVFDDGSGEGRLLYAGGFFSRAGGLPAANVARWNGSSWAALGGGANDLVYAFAAFGRKALYAGGWFHLAADSLDGYLARWQGCPDTTPPVITCPEPIEVRDSGSPGEVVTFVVTASDETDAAPIVTCVPPSGSVFPPGTTRVRCTARDAEGNRATCAFEVVVRGKLRRP